MVRSRTLHPKRPNTAPRRNQHQASLRIKFLNHVVMAPHKVQTLRMIQDRNEARLNDRRQPVVVG